MTTARRSKVIGIVFQNRCKRVHPFHSDIHRLSPLIGISNHSVHNISLFGNTSVGLWKAKEQPNWQIWFIVPAVQRWMACIASKRQWQCFRWDGSMQTRHSMGFVLRFRFCFGTQRSLVCCVAVDDYAIGSIVCGGKSCAVNPIVGWHRWWWLCWCLMGWLEIGFLAKWLSWREDEFVFWMPSKAFEGNGFSSTRLAHSTTTGF